MREGKIWSVEKTNKAVFIMVTAVIVLFLVGWTTDLLSERITPFIFASMLTFLAGQHIFGAIVLRRNGSSANYRYIALAGFALVYCIAVFSRPTHFSYLYILPVAMLYMLYEDTRLVKAIAIGIMAVSAVNMAYQIHSGLTSQDDLVGYMIQAGFVVLMSIGIYLTTKVNINMHNEKLERVMKASDALESSTIRLRTLNHTAEMLLTASEDEMMDTLMLAMEIVGRGVAADRVQIWRNEVVDGELHFVMRYQWLSEVGEQKTEVPIGLGFPYSSVPEWHDMFLQGKSINSPVSKLPLRDTEFLGHYDIVSVLCLPLFLSQEFIGFFSIDDCTYERTFTDEEVEMFASVGLMLTSTFNKIQQDKELEALERERHAMRLAQKLLDNSPVFIEFWDTEGNMIDCNGKIMDVLGISDKAEYTKNFAKYSMPIQPCGTPPEELSIEMINLAVTQGQARSEWTFLLPNGDILPTETTWVYITHQSEPMVIVYSLDSRPIKAAVEAEESNRAKSRFLARMSHEIRTPITAVMGISEMQLRGEEMPPRTEEAFSKIYDSSKTLLSIVNDILDFSKIESGKMSLLEAEYDMANLANDASQLHLVYLNDKDVSFQMQVDKNLPAKLIGDSLRISQIINNLLTNAFKYTESGSVILSLSHSASDKDGYIMLSISIKDTGIGMSAEQIEEVQGERNEYVRLHEYEKPSVSGTGLGLSIVYSMAQMMDAVIDLSSEVGKGTHVIVTIPQKTVNSDVLGEELATRLENFESGAWSATENFDFVPEQMPYGNVLVVDDLEINLHVAEAMLESFGLTVELCEGGEAAIDKVAQGKVYDVIFLDYMMPGMDGIEVAKALWSMGYDQPIVALTANAIKGQAEMFMRNGFSGFMSKPIDIKALSAILMQFVKKQNP